MKIHLSRNLSREIITWSKKACRLLGKIHNKGIQMLTKCQEESHVCSIINLKGVQQKLIQGYTNCVMRVLPIDSWCQEVTEIFEFSHNVKDFLNKNFVKKNTITSNFPLKIIIRKFYLSICISRERSEHSVWWKSRKGKREKMNASCNWEPTQTEGWGRARIQHPDPGYRTQSFAAFWVWSPPDESRPDILHSLKVQQSPAKFKSHEIRNK